MYVLCSTIGRLKMVADSEIESVASEIESGALPNREAGKNVTWSPPVKFDCGRGGENTPRGQLTATVLVRQV